MFLPVALIVAGLVRKPKETVKKLEATSKGKKVIRVGGKTIEEETQILSVGEAKEESTMPEVILSDILLLCSLQP